MEHLYNFFWPWIFLPLTSSLVVQSRILQHQPRVVWSIPSTRKLSFLHCFCIEPSLLKVKMHPYPLHSFTLPWPLAVPQHSALHPGFYYLVSVSRAHRLLDNDPSLAQEIPYSFSASDAIVLSLLLLLLLLPEPSTWRAATCFTRPFSGHFIAHMASSRGISAH